MFDTNIHDESHRFFMSLETKDELILRQPLLKLSQNLGPHSGFGAFVLNR